MGDATTENDVKHTAMARSSIIERVENYFPSIPLYASISAHRLMTKTDIIKQSTFLASRQSLLSRKNRSNAYAAKGSSSILRRSRTSRSQISGSKNLFMEFEPVGLKLSNMLQTMSRRQYENTFQLGPEKLFDAYKAEKIIKYILTETLTNIRYHQSYTPEICLSISELIKQSVKDLNFDRYKIISLVQIIEKEDQGFLTMNGFLWEPSTDRYAKYVLENNEFYVIAVVYAIYLP